MATTRIRAVTYARFSSDKQKDSSIEDQQRTCQGLIDREGWQLVAEFEDRAISGAIKDRPQFLAMQAAAKRKEFDVLVVEKLDRFARDSVVNEQVIRRLEFLEIRIVGIQDGYDSQSKARKMIRGFAGMKADMFRDDLAINVHRGQMGQAEKKYWNGGKPYGYRMKFDRDKSRLDKHGEPMKLGTQLQLDPAQAKVVREMFTRFAEGESRATIANDLNRRKVPSPGSTWKRKVRICSGWRASAIRVILHNPLYTGLQRWNTARFVQDPDTDKHLRRHRPKEEWVVNQIEAIRIVSDELFARVQARRKTLADSDPRLKQGGRPNKLLSGLLRCATCGRNYVMADARAYACGSFIGGGAHACSNNERAPKEKLEALIVEPLKNDLLHPDRVKRMARELEVEFAKQVQARAARAGEAPKELQELEARIARLRARLQVGDADMTEDELQAAIDRAEGKRRELQAARPQAKQQAKVLSMLPKAAAMYRRQIELGLAGELAATAKARLILRDLVGPVTLTPGPAKGELWASYKLNPAALVKGAGTCGRGDRI